MISQTISYNASDYANGHVTYYVGDVHEGAANFNGKAFAEAVRMIATDGDAWIGIGDYIDAIPYWDKRFNVYEVGEKYAIRDLDDLPKQQCEKFMEAIEPIKDKCIGLLYGNHEDKYCHNASFDVVRHMCNVMEVPNLRHKAWVSYAFEYGTTKVIPVKMVMCHGAGGGGMREGYPINKAYDVFRWDIADVHIMGHIHQMATDMTKMNRFEYGTLRQDSTWFAVNGCFMNKATLGNDSYFEQRPGRESSIGMLKQTIYPSAAGKNAFRIKLEKIYL